MMMTMGLEIGIFVGKAQWRKQEVIVAKPPFQKVMVKAGYILHNEWRNRMDIYAGLPRQVCLNI